MNILNPIRNKQYLYIAECNTVYKIGVSSLPEQRLSLIRTDNYKRVSTVAIIELDNAYLVEKFVHDLLKESGYHVRGEWFNLPPDTIDELLELLPQVDSEIQSELDDHQTET